MLLCCLKLNTCEGGRGDNGRQRVAVSLHFATTGFQDELRELKELGFPSYVPSANQGALGLRGSGN
jgi:hypothetical protein